MADRERQHWLVDQISRAGRTGADRLVIPQGTAMRDAWALACQTCGMTDADLAALIATQYRLRVAELATAEPRAIKLVPESVARRFGILPLRETDRNLIVASSNPVDMEAEQALGFASGRTPVIEVASPTALAEAIDQHYSPERAVEQLLGTMDAAEADTVQVLDDTAPEAIAAKDLVAGPVIKLTNIVLQAGVTERASDIHIEPGRTGGVVRLRVDGVLRQHMQMPVAVLNRVVSRVKILGGMDIADRLRPQDGRSRIQVHGKTYDLRISTVPTGGAEKAVIRILDPSTTPELGKLGMSPHELDRVRKLLGFREGIVVVTGPTGSGKTTTLYAAIRELSTGRTNIMTVEDPVEYELGGITQIQVEPKRNVTFASALRAILRQDPDVVFVGEIRDLETAEIAVQASMTGHLVLATLHTNDAAGLVARLVDMGLSRVNIAASLRGVVGQRLIRRVCDACRVTIGDAMTPAEAELAKRYGVKPMVRSAGCSRCSQSGFRGRLAVDEVLMVTPQLADGIARGVPQSELQSAAVAGGMRPLREVALEMVRNGLTTLDEVERVLGEATDETAVNAPAAAEAAPEQPHVFLVDDDVVVRTLARALLEKNGVRVTEADNGREALDRLGQPNDFSLMILDLDMPVLSGLETLRQVRSSASTATFPVIVLTGSDAHGDEVEVMDAGADDYFKKPLDPPRFIARVKAALRRAAT